MGRAHWIPHARGAASPAALALAVALLALAGCGGTERAPPAGPPPAPTLLFLAGDGELTVVDVDAASAEVHPLAELAPGDPPYRIVRRGNELVVYGGDTYILDPELRAPPRKLGDSWFFIPSVEPDRVWLAILDPASPETVRALAAVREVAVDGRVTVPDVRPPAGRWPLAAVGHDLVFEDGRGGLELWSPASGEVTRRLPGTSPGPSHGDLFAWCERDGRVLHVLDVASGRDRAVAPPQGSVAFDCWTGAFSPDGTTLALPAAASDGYEADRALALVDVGSGLARAVEGSTVDPGYVFVAWSSAGDRVFVSGGARHERRQLLEYRLGAPRAVPLAVEVGDFYGLAAR